MTTLPRLQLALNVSDLDAAVDFYGRLFDAEPHKRRPGYANFAIAEPPLKLVLIENPGAAETLNHLGVEVASTQDVSAAQARVTDAGLDPRVEDDVVCCHARQDKVWVDSPDGAAWEIYTITDDDPRVDLAEPVCCAG